MTALQSGNMQHAFPWHATFVLQCFRMKYKKTKTRRGGSRDIFMSSLVPINSLTTHASCSGPACGKVTQTEEALSGPLQPTKAVVQAGKYCLVTWFASQQVWVNMTCVFKVQLKRGSYGKQDWVGFTINSVITWGVFV